LERSVFRYILRHTWRDQVLLLVVTAVSFPLIYINLEIPKRIINSAIGGKDVPSTFLGFEVDQISYLFALSGLLLTLITVNGAIKYWLNVYRGVVGERTIRRLRHDLYQKVLRFPLPQFKTMSAGEIIPMIVAETEPVGTSSASRSICRSFRAGCCSPTSCSSSTRTPGWGSRPSRSTRRRST
jgi:ABC-type multidrug transport system fused ATPase/permease subunit